MDSSSILFAKIAALKKNFDSINYGGGSGQTNERHVGHLFPTYFKLTKEVKELHPELFSDLPNLEMPKHMGVGEVGKIYERNVIEPLVRNLDYILEVRSNYRI